ncbi:MAG TPA: hypothetical protein PLM24_00505 [Methanothrix sp.]|nr:hypothetical protein [Methanothrix sp.]HPJ83354.1 hypothetical protein [Methanothrix sp.]HPR65597.1 hypothetical protein [Methanothrix sp.]
MDGVVGKNVSRHPSTMASPRICSLATDGWRRRGIGARWPSSAPESMATDRQIDSLVRELRGLRY